eukprot:m.179991 g.179991  ORF g.179991 m.179991 type:complete len:825 (+) comp15373_c1_seq2:174-2648(+)
MAKKKQKDFEKVREKVGKKLKRLNETTAEVKTKKLSIAMKTRPEASEAVSIRGQTLRDLLTKLGHPNEGVRKENLVGLRNYFQLNSAELAQPNTLLHFFERIPALVHDEAHSVRRALVGLLGAVVQQVPASRIAPFMSGLVAHVSAAMTQLTGGIRIDSLDFIKLLLTAYPRLLVENGQPIFANFLQLIAHENSTSRTTLSTNGKLASQRVRLRVLTILHNFLRIALSDNQERTLHAATNEHKPRELRVCQGTRAATCLFRPSPPSFATNSATDTTFLSPARLGEYLAHELLPILIECWLETKPAATAAAAPAVSGTALEDLQTIAALCSLVLSRAALTEPLILRILPLLVKHLSSALPVGEAAWAQGSDTAPAYLCLNLTVVKILLVAHQRAAHVVPPELVAFLTSVMKHLTEEQGRVVSPGSFKLLVECVGLCHEALDATDSLPLLQSLLAMFGNGDASQQKELLPFFAGLLSPAPAEFTSLRRDFALALPRLLWQLKATDPYTSRQVLTFLQSQLVLPSEEPLTGLSAAMACILLASARGRTFYGPFVKYPIELQHQFCDILFFLPTIGVKFLRALLSCLHTRGMDPSVALRASRALLLRSDMASGPAQSFLTSCLLGYCTERLTVKPVEPFVSCLGLTLTMPRVLLPDSSEAPYTETDWLARLATIEALMPLTADEHFKSSAFNVLAPLKTLPFDAAVGMLAVCPSGSEWTGRIAPLLICILAGTVRSGIAGPALSVFVTKHVAASLGSLRIFGENLRSAKLEASLLHDVLVALLPVIAALPPQHPSECTTFLSYLGSRSHPVVVARAAELAALIRLRFL